MAKALSTMQTNVGNMVRDTSSSLKTKITVWLNDAYQDAWRRCMWDELVDDDFTFTAVVDQANYVFSSGLSITDFGEEIFVADVTNGHSLTRKKSSAWWEERARAYNAGSISSGNPIYYRILPESGAIQLDPPPDATDTYAMPYKKKVTDLSGSSDTISITGLEYFMEHYAISQAYAYKRQFASAQYFLNLAEQFLAKRVKEEKTKFNEKYQRVLYGRRYPNYRNRLTGDLSYDSI